MQLVFVPQPPGETRVRPDRGAAVSQPHEQPEEAGDRRLVCGLQCRGSLPGRRRAGRVPVALPRLGQCPPRLRGASSQPIPLQVQPPREVGCIGDVKPREQLPAVQRQRRLDSSFVHRLLELGGIAPELIGRKPELIVAAGDEDGGAKRPSQEVERLAQRMASPLGVVLGPEHRENSVPAVKCSGDRKGKEGEEGQAPRLREDRLDGGASPRDHVDSAKRAQLDHADGPSKERHPAG